MNTPATVQDLLPGARRRRRWPAYAAGALALIAVVLAAGALLRSEGTGGPRYRTVEVVRGDLTVRVSATGQLEPVNQVEVGTEISGTVESVSVDFNDRVRVGDVLARLDTDQLEARQRMSQAALALAEARVKEARATLAETRNRLRRAQDLIKRGMSSQEELDSAEAAYARAEAAAAVAEAQVDQARAQLDADTRTLEKALIRSPIDGIVLRRQVEPGQTVAASLQTPVLFTLAENLAQMELHVAVDEADVGQVREGQQATFTVDAYPDRTFPAVITQVRYAPETVDGVVTYGAVLRVDNADLALRPGMTATADITVESLTQVLLVPNAALRFRPPAAGPAASGARGGLVGLLLPRFPRGDRGGRRGTGEEDRGTRVWTLRDGQLHPVPVTTGSSDGQMTHLVSGEVGPGTPVVVDILRETP